MSINLLDNVPDTHRFYLTTGKYLKNVKELYSELKNVDEYTFNYHVNDAKNDIYNWIKDVYHSKELADDLLNCSTKEAVLHSLRNHLEKASVSKLFAELPSGYSTERSILDDLPKGYDKQRIGHAPQNEKKEEPLHPSIVTKNAAKLIATKPSKVQLKKQSVRLIKVKQVKKISKMKKVACKKKNVSKPVEKVVLDFNELGKVKPLDSDSIIKKMKGVYGF